VREQFGLEIGRFEGIEERLARIAGLTYLMDATRRLTAAAVDAGEKPSVASAIAKCYLTEGMRLTVNDAMDVVGGAGICVGPRNVLAGGYAALPIGITVEGANVLTRCMIVFGQGAIRCHPFVQDEMRGAQEKDVALFDRALWGHVGFVFRNMARTLWLGLTDGALASVPLQGPAARYYRRSTRLSAAFALAADLAMGTLGGALKRKESLTGRLADIHAWLYLSSAALKRFHDEGSKERDLPALRWACEHAHHEAQQAVPGFLANLPLRPAAWLLRALAVPAGSLVRAAARCAHARRGAGPGRRRVVTRTPHARHVRAAGRGAGLGPARDRAAEAGEGAGRIEEGPDRDAREEAREAPHRDAARARGRGRRADGRGAIADRGGRARARASAIAVDAFPARSYAVRTA
jgi:hypothetical protein